MAQPGLLLVTLLVGLAGMPALAKSSWVRVLIQRVEQQDSMLQAYVLILGTEGEPLAEPEADDLLLQETDGEIRVKAAQAIRFAQTLEPLELLVLAPAGRVSQGYQAELRDGLRQVLAEPWLRAVTRLSVVVGPEPEDVLCAGASGDPLDACLERLTVTRTPVSLTATLRSVLAQLPKEASGRRLLLLASEEPESMPADELDYLARTARKRKVVIDSLILSAKAPSRGLSRLAELSFGVPHSCSRPDEVRQQLRLVAREIGNQLRVTFSSAIKLDGAEHRFAILFRGAKNEHYSAEWLHVSPEARSPKLRLAVILCLALLLLGMIVWLLLRVRHRRRAAVAERPEPHVIPHVDPPPSVPATEPTTAAEARRAEEPKLPDDNEGALAWISALDGPEAGVTYQVRGEMTFGTDPHCQVVLKDPFASRFHCKIVSERGGFWVVDLGSKNGVLMNGKQLDRGELLDNAVFAVGQTRFRFKKSEL